MRQGVSLIEVVVAIAIIVLLFGGIYTAYVGILDALTNSEARASAASVIGKEIETIRNLPYDSVGTVGGFPPGILASQKTVTSTAGYVFGVKTTVRNIDDPFDGTLGGVPNDTAPADYKLVELEISCASCARFAPLTLTTTVAPKNLEGALSGGSLFINVFDASALPVQNANVHVVNASVTPAIDLTDVTNVNGTLQLVGVPTSTQRYQITITKTGYSSEKTYLPGDPANPNPVAPHATVAPQSLTQVSFAIDKTSTFTVQSSDYLCAPVANAAFTLAGSKKIGTSPDVLKFTTSSQTDAGGAKTFSNLEWDTYLLSFTGAGYDTEGTIPLSPFVVNPNSTQSERLVLAPASLESLLVAVKDAASGAGIQDASVTVSGGSYASTRVTGHEYLTDTDWSGGGYIAQSGGLDTESAPGTVKFAGPPYPTSTTAWLVSHTFDTGGATSTYYFISWNPTSEPPQTGAQSLKFQIATNNDNATWNYVGPDGTANTYYTTPGTATAAAHNNQRYLRYKAFFTTQDGNTTPTLTGVSIEFKGVCVPNMQTRFSGMPADTYLVTARAAGYQDATSSIAIGTGAYQKEIQLSR